jgi:acetylornithine deacetylase/succinyl-diaminopimelate desuccinylase family protein
MQAEAVLELVDGQDVIDLTRRMVAVPTENPPGNEGPVAQVLGDYLAAAGLDVRFTQVRPNRPNVVATLPGTREGPALLYTGHTDTMPLSGQWTYDPHGGVIRDGKLYGRGSADMKGGLAAMAVAAAAIARSGAQLEGTLILAAVIDEEAGSAGTDRLVQDGIRADWAVISEPTNNVPVIVSNGQVDYEFILRGQSGHGSTPSEGRNAIYDGIRLVQALRALMETEFSGRDYPLVGRPSFSVGTFESGVQTSVIPDYCRITLDRRVVPSETVDEAIAEVENLLAGLRREDPRFDAEMSVFVRIDPGTIPASSPVVQALRTAAARVCGADPGVAGLRATTDAATLCNQGGIPTLIMGPGSIDEAHKADEFVPVAQIKDAARIFALGALRLLGSPASELL